MGFRAFCKTVWEGVKFVLCCRCLPCCGSPDPSDSTDVQANDVDGRNPQGRQKEVLHTGRMKEAPRRTGDSRRAGRSNQVEPKATGQAQHGDRSKQAPPTPVTEDTAGSSNGQVADEEVPERGMDKSNKSVEGGGSGDSADGCSPQPGTPPPGAATKSMDNAAGTPSGGPDGPVSDGEMSRMGFEEVSGGVGQLGGTDWGVHAIGVGRSQSGTLPPNIPTQVADHSPATSRGSWEPVDESTLGTGQPPADKPGSEVFQGGFEEAGGWEEAKDNTQAKRLVGKPAEAVASEAEQHREEAPSTSTGTGTTSKPKMKGQKVRDAAAASAAPETPAVVNSPTETGERAPLIILVVGRTGVGKSTLINALLKGTNVEPAKVSNSVQLCTREVKGYPLPSDHRIMLVDTPGLDNASGISDHDVWSMIITWLKNMSNTQSLFGGVIYLYPLPGDGTVKWHTEELVNAFLGRCPRVVTTLYISFISEGMGVSLIREEQKGLKASLVRKGLPKFQIDDPVEEVGKVHSLSEASRSTTSVSEPRPLGGAQAGNPGNAFETGKGKADNMPSFLASSRPSAIIDKLVANAPLPLDIVIKELEQVKAIARRADRTVGTGCS